MSECERCAKLEAALEQANEAARLIHERCWDECSQRDDERIVEMRKNRRELLGVSK